MINQQQQQKISWSRFNSYSWQWFCYV